MKHSISKEGWQDIHKVDVMGKTFKDSPFTKKEYEKRSQKTKLKPYDKTKERRGSQR